MRDLYHNVLGKPVIAPAATAVATNTAQVGAIIDRLGFESLTYVILTGTLADTDATFAVLLEESDAADLSGSNVVADEDTVNTQSAVSFDHTNSSIVRMIGYIGNRRYTRLTITPANNTGAAPMAAVAVLGSANSRPTQ